jgi:NTP pyrophosphatase (non-canonical NTP hydrolase)
VTLDDYQNLAGRTDVDHDADYYALLLTAEAGEVAALFQKVRHGKPLSSERLAEELGDALWAVARCAAKHGFKLSQIAQGNAAKLRARWPDGFGVTAKADEKCAAPDECSACVADELVKAAERPLRLPGKCPEDAEDCDHEPCCFDLVKP